MVKLNKNNSSLPGVCVVKNLDDAANQKIKVVIVCTAKGVVCFTLKSQSSETSWHPVM